MGSIVPGKYIITPKGGAIPMDLVQSRRNPDEVKELIIDINHKANTTLEKKVRYILAYFYAGDPGDSISIKFKSDDGKIEKTLLTKSTMPRGKTFFGNTLGFELK